MDGSSFFKPSATDEAYDVKVMCPKTGSFVRTGFQMTVHAFNASKVSNSTFNCFSCGSVHTWNDVEAVLSN